MSRGFLFLAFAIVAFADTAGAHHNMSALYNVDEVMTVSGTLTRIDWRNPHIELDVEVKDGTTVQKWTLEGPPPSAFRKRDVDKGDMEMALNKTVTVDVSPARDGSHAALLRTMTLPGGKVACC